MKDLEIGDQAWLAITFSDDSDDDVDFDDDYYLG